MTKSLQYKKEYMIRYRKTDKYKAYHKKYREDYKVRRRKLRKDVKNAILNFFGGKCVRCGFSDTRALQIDHINGDGKKDRDNIDRYDFEKIVLKSIENNEKKYQILCANCNWIKRAENNENGGLRWIIKKMV